MSAEPGAAPQMQRVDDIKSGRLVADVEGMLVVLQDEFNRLPNENQNFKLISWRDIKSAGRFPGRQ